MKTLTLIPWPVHPAQSGGQERCWNLAQQLPEATIYALDWTGNSSHQRIGNINYKTIGADDNAITQSKKLFSSGIKTYDPMPTLTRNNLTTIRREIDNYDPDIIILEHPWLLELIDGRPFVYDSHNCETLNAIQQRPNSLELQLVKDLERRATQQAEHMFYTSEQDFKAMKQLYPFTTESTLIPNGVTLPDEVSNGEQLNLIFVGSLYGPNIQAAKELIALAPQLPEYQIQIIGNVCNALTNSYPNVQLVGQVTDKQLHYYFSNAHAFINLIRQGSGTHLKVGRALAYGIPVISTPTGARGYTTPIQVTPANILPALQAVRYNRLYLSDIAREEAATLTWQTIGETYRQVLNGLQ